MWCTLRDVVVFVAGAELFHTVVHVMMPHYVSLPMDMKFMVMTASMNNYAIVVNAVITVLLLWWAMRLRKAECAVCEPMPKDKAKK